MICKAHALRRFALTKTGAMVGAVGLCFWGAIPSVAQPPQQATTAANPAENRPVAPGEQELGIWHTNLSPYQVVARFLVNASVGDSTAAVFLISGAKWQSPHVKKLGEMARGKARVVWLVEFPPNEVFQSKPAVDNAGGAIEETTISVQVGIRDEIDVAVSHEERVTLRREATKGGAVWRIVSEPENAESQRNEGVIQTLVSFYVQPGLQMSPNPPTEEQRGKKLTQFSPQQVVTQFVQSASEGDGKGAAFLLSGVEWNSSDVEKLGNLLAATGYSDWRVGIETETAALATRPASSAPASDEIISIAVNVGVVGGLSTRMHQAENVKLRRESTKGGPVWRIIPDLLPTIPAAETAAFGAAHAGVVRTLASYFAKADESVQMMSLRVSQRQVKSLTLGVMQFVQDYQQVYKFNTENFKVKLLPYMRSEAFFTAPGDADGVQSYQFNPELFGKRLIDIVKPSSIVLIFMGAPDKLDFRYGGKTVIGYADGHVESIDAEAAKSLRWMP
jgi:prepilin-type processing-associated H-X9-DG protein